MAPAQAHRDDGGVICDAPHEEQAVLQLHVLQHCGAGRNTAATVAAELIESTQVQWRPHSLKATAPCRGSRRAPPTPPVARRRATGDKGTQPLPPPANPRPLVARRCPSPSCTTSRGRCAMSAPASHTFRVEPRSRTDWPGTLGACAYGEEGAGQHANGSGSVTCARRGSDACRPMHSPMRAIPVR